jgi:hypothetical protein
MFTSGENPSRCGKERLRNEGDSKWERKKGINGNGRIVPANFMSNNSVELTREA